MIFDIQRFSTHDGPGIRTVVFFKGCPLLCPWCENPESQSYRPELLYTRSYCVGCGSCLRPAEGALRKGSLGLEVVRSAIPPAVLAELCPSTALRLAGREASAREILAEVLMDKSFFEKSGGGLTVSGGEPLAQIELVIELLAAARDEGLDIAIETCLSVSSERVERAAALSPLWLADLKHVDPEAYRAATGGEVELPLGNLRFLAQSGAELCLRVPVIPGFNADEASLRRILEFAAALPRPSSAPRSLHLLPYHDLAAGKYAALDRVYAYPAGLRPEQRVIEGAAELGTELGLAVSIGG
jgi:pyruvate formate lyase activating enzyme